MSSPLLAGNNLTAATPELIKILTAKGPLSVNQDPLALQVRNNKRQTHYVLFPRLPCSSQFLHVRIDAWLTRQARDERTVMSQISKSTMMDGVSHCVT